MKAAEQYFPVVLFIILYKVVLTFESVVEILKCDHSNESYWAVLSCGAVYYPVQGGSNFWVCGWNPKVWSTIQMKTTEQYFPVVLFIILYKVVLTFESVVEILKRDIQMKAAAQYFPVVLFIVLYKVVLTFESVDEILKRDIQMKATEQYFPMLLFIMLYKVILTFESMDEILKCEHSNESYWAVLCYAAVYYVVQGVVQGESVDEICK